jgi:SAM-dependent methyltransferase
MSETLTSLRDLYHDAAGVRTARLTRATAEPIYRDYLNFVAAFASAGKFLDVGCGVGWSTYCATERGYDAVGVDLNPCAFEPPSRGGLRLEYGCGTNLPFGDNTFDVVGTYQTLEHVSAPERMLEEMIRVTRPGGVICVVGPNLLSPLNSIRGIAYYVWLNRPAVNILIRRPGMPRHPFGNTLPEAVAALGRNLYLLARKAVRRRHEFTFRQPDLAPPFHADNDAVYLCNPLDLTRYFRDAGCQILRGTALGRRAWTMMLAGGTWVAVRKL